MTKELQTTIKSIQTGDFIEFYLYENPISYNFHKNPKKEDKKYSDTVEIQQDKNKIDSIRRTKNNIKRLINGNIHFNKEQPKFLTLTFRENLTDIQEANYQFKKFIQRLNYRFENKTQYIAVHEKQNRGAIHYHLLTLNLPFIEQAEIKSIWRDGLNIKKVRKTPGLYNYLTKYITKSFSNSDLKGKKRYFQTLPNQPITLYNEKECLELHKQVENNVLHISPYTYVIKDLQGRVINTVTKQEVYV